MDPVTHGLAGYVVAKTGLTRDTGRWGVVAGVIASLFPDVDSLLGPFVGTEFTLKYHRGLTNSIFLVVPFSPPNHSWLKDLVVVVEGLCAAG